MERLLLRLYVAGDGPNSVAARANLRRMLAHVDAPHTIEVVDCLREPMRALQEGVLVTPTLVRVEPAPTQMIVGTLSDEGRVLAALGVDRDGDAAGSATATTGADAGGRPRGV